MENNMHTKIVLFLAFIIVAACAIPTVAANKILGETFVLVGEEPANFLFGRIVPQSVLARSTYGMDDKGCVTYQEGIDYIVDYKNATIRRTKDSKIPDYSTNLVRNLKVFNHTTDAGFGNWGLLFYVDYSTKERVNLAPKTNQSKYLKKTAEKLRSGKEILYIAYGDSITNGGEATTPDRIYWQRWADNQKKRFPKAKITTMNGATGGDSTYQGVERLEDKVLKYKPDLVSIGFGMNDNNGDGIPQDIFKSNLVNMISRIRQVNPDVEIILVSAFNPNNIWFYNSHRMAEYAKTTQETAKEQN